MASPTKIRVYDPKSCADKQCLTTKFQIICRQGGRSCVNGVRWKVHESFWIWEITPRLYWSTTTPPYFFRSHRSSILDFHFLSRYSYIKGNHWTHLLAKCIPYGLDWASLMTTWGLLGHYLGKTWGWLGQYFGKTWQDSGILWHTLVLLSHTLTYSGIL